MKKERFEYMEIEIPDIKTAFSSMKKVYIYGSYDVAVKFWQNKQVDYFNMFGGLKVITEQEYKLGNLGK
jgi:uncharacterized protein YaeQ